MGRNSDRTVEFLALYNREQRAIYAYIRSLLFSPEEAEEVFQETCIALWEHFEQFEPGTSFRAWARQIARHRTLAWCKKKRRRDELVFSEDVIDLLAADEEGPREADERREALRECARKLREEDRALIDRRYAERVTTVRLAEELGRPLNTVYKALQRIRSGLKQCIERAIARARTLEAEG